MDPIKTTSATTALDPALTAGTDSKSRADKQKSQFLQLLVAQLKGQNPLNPMDGSEFVAQLAQFSSLEELINIRGSLDNMQQLLKPQTATTPSTTSGNPFGLATL